MSGCDLAALVSAIEQRPLYVAYVVIVKLLDMATQLLKRDAEHGLKIGGIEVEIAWSFIASLIFLGLNFVRPHFPRLKLLVFWRNAPLKPPNKDSTNNVGRYVTDITCHIASVLSNALLFANEFIAQNVEDPFDIQPPVVPQEGLTMQERKSLIRRRVYGYTL